MSAIIVPIEIQLTERSQSILAALSGAIGTTQEPATASASAVDLQPGEHYAGVVLDESGQVVHHLVLMAQRPDVKLKWQEAMDWAASVGGAGIHAVRSVLEDYAAMLETLSERTMTECHRLTERRGHEILRGVRQPHDVVVTAI